MNSKKKKSSKSAFSFFLDDYILNERNKGRNISYKIGAEECAPKWNVLPQEEKEYYKNLVSVNKLADKNNKHNKFTSNGLSYAEVEKKIKMTQEKIEKEDQEIKATVHHLDYDLLKTKLFYIVHCNYYCKTYEGNYIPGEIAISEFSLGDGVRRTYHTLISPESIPRGFAFEAQTNINDVHGLPFPPYPEGNCNYSKIYCDILKFLKFEKFSDEKVPPLYSIENNVKVSENILSVLAENDREGKNHFRVYLLHKLFFWLKNKCAQVSDKENDEIGFPVMWNAINEIEKDVFRYITGISCPYHCDIEEKYHSCSLSIVQRFVYIFCDHCCQYIDVKLVPGKHIKVFRDTSEITTVFNSETRSNPQRNKVNNIGAICSFYGGSNVPGWTKVTSSNFSDEDEDEDEDSISDKIKKISVSLKNEEKLTFKSVTAGRGKFKSCFDSNTYEKDFPDLVGRGRRILRP